jgi:hypothetical protein
MRKFRLKNKEKEELSDQDIAQYRDFENVVTNYNKVLDSVHKKPLYRQPKTFLILLVIVLIAYVISEATRAKEHPRPTPIEQVE